ncbi:RIP metalloprotease RseP [Peptococcaceae bacterium 1198_IL3148]
MQTFIASVFVFGILIFFHELGHFAVAKAVGIRVYEFSLGFGNKIFGFNRGGTDYSVRLFPLGGYVRMAGMDPEEDEKERDYKEDEGFNSKTVGQRFWVIAAGAIMNFVLAILLLATIYGVQGIPTLTTEVGAVVEESPADAAGIKPGDKIVAINGVNVTTWQQLIDNVNNAGEELTVKLQRNDQVKTLQITPELSDDDRYVIGIQADPDKAFMQRANPLEALWQGAQSTYQVTALIISFIGKMFTNEAPVDLGGPVAIVSEISNAAQMGIFQLLQLAAFLSINLGLFNLFPIPALDGSRLLFLTWEKIVGKPVDPAKEGFIHMIGFGLLLLLMVVITYNDILRLIGVDS